MILQIANTIEDPMGVLLHVQEPAKVKLSADKSDDNLKNYYSQVC